MRPSTRPDQGAPALDIGDRLEPGILERAARPLRVRVGDRARAETDACHAFMLDKLASDTPVYGVSTGFGPLVGEDARPDIDDQADNAFAHLTAGQGPDLPAPVVRACLLVRLHSLARGRSGVTARLLDALVAALATPIAPAVPELGSLGASGDLIPLTYLSQALAGRGYAYLAGERLPARDALRRLGLEPITPDGREALALVNGTSLTSAAAGLALAGLLRSARTAATLTAVLADLLGCERQFLAPPLLDAYGHPEVIRVGEALRERLRGGERAADRPLQEPYSIRCAPQLIGAAWSSLRHVEDVVERDLNNISDNPLFFPEQDLVAHGGNFFTQPAAFAADLMSLVATQLANLAERQLDLLIDPNRNGGLNAMLASDPGSQHGVQGVQLAATAMVIDMRRRATPASVQTVPTNLHNQDVVPCGTHAALNAFQQAGALRLVQGSLAVALRQAAHLSPRRSTAHGCAAVIDRLAELVAPIDPDRPLDGDVRQAADLLDAVAAEEQDASTPTR
ncbi:HAL/PAL/TAL family ammonia-lyase [Actinokineospora iranica]|uniref:Histidine ammonia-lyase/tyrosine ammonia-lyase n=1 Tax=Actinokineospora iranica TaxID=1271860 RepID=A0A1G6S6T3_9PSEU|nr:aromatic amino acid ammonia-lyase [Actinokineospora iranica]SDD12588.1 histidine ammonia-lyase/tyrosine ammonia-lyase [Actinokineospora iranica]